MIFTDILGGFETLLNDQYAIWFVLLASFVGIIFGALPGLTAAAAIAMMLPILIAYNDEIGGLAGLAFLYVIGKSGRYGGSIAAILFNTPGTAASAATMQDGYPMTQSGRPGKALKTATISSAFGDYFGEIVLIFGAVFIATFTRKFGPPENFAIYLMAFVIIGSVVSDSIIKGIISTLFGASIALIGEDTITGQFKMTMGIDELESGMALVPLLIGVFVISEVIIQAEKSAKVKMVDMSASNIDDPTAQYFTWAEFKRCLPLMFRSSIIGSLIGMMPGLGSSVACFVAYGEEKRKAKNKDKWGTGVVEGIAAPESANNAVSGPSMIPLLTLGIPGSTIAAVLIGMFLVNGLQVGPQIFATEPPLFMGGQLISPREFIFGMFAAGLIGIACYAVIGYFMAPFIGRLISKLPTQYLYPFIFMISIAASYSSRASIWDVGFALLFGVIGYGMRRTNFSAAAFIIAFVLTASMEEAFRQSMIISDNGLMLFLSFEYQNKFSYAPIFLIIGTAVVVFRASSAHRAKNKAHS
ncbi:tripartite tricarboxylate transporter permease [Alphaproteobacteria bacterium]|nr:tripartite tricarboxylate transporter permease [Alphaproteobacteria bacterium]MDC1121097.1 tripartite tricarboxylate transporter permease [Alphaproteobacteria bacterium]